MQQNVDINESINELIDPDLFLRSFGIPDDFVDNMADLYNASETSSSSKPSGQPPGVIIKNIQSSSATQHNIFAPTTSQQQQTFQASHNLQTMQSFHFQPQSSNSNSFGRSPNSSSSSNGNMFVVSSPVTLQQRSGVGDETSPKDCHVTLPLETLQNLLSQQNISYGYTEKDALAALGQYQQSDGLGAIRKRSHDSYSQEVLGQQQQGEQKFGDIMSAIFSVPSPVAMSPIYVEQKPIPLNGSDGLMTHSSIRSPRPTSRPSPASTPPLLGTHETQRDREYKKRHDSGRCTPIGKRSRPQSPASDCDSDGSYRDREPLQWANTGRLTPTETKPNIRLEDLVDEDKYNKRKRSTSGGGEKPPPATVDKDGRKKDPMKAMLEQLQSHIPHIGNPDEEKVSHAGLLVEGSDYIRSLMRENNTTKENVEALKMKIEQLNAEIEDFQQKLPEHGSSSIHRIVSSRGKSIPDMFADHVRQRTQSDWRYWVFTSIMGHFVHSYSQDISNISPREMETTSIDWLSTRMSLQQLRKDAFRKLAKLCSKTSIMEDPLKLPEEARSFVALNDPDPAESKAEKESYGGKF